MKNKINSFLLSLCFGLALYNSMGVFCTSVLRAAAQQKHKKDFMHTVQGVHQFTVPLENGTELSLADLKGKVVLFVNTAAKCGFAPQYKELEALYQRYKDQGFVIIGVSSDDFHQEIKNVEERTCFLDDNFPTTFPSTEMLVVTGKNAHPLYQWLNKQAGWFGTVKWNFHKFLVGKDGEFIDWFAPTTKPDSKKIIKAIEKALAE